MPSRTQDEVQISDFGSFVAQARELPAIRHDRVAQLRAEIASGAYDIDSKLDLTLERLLDELA